MSNDSVMICFTVLYPSQGQAYLLLPIEAILSS